MSQTEVTAMEQAVAGMLADSGQKDCLSKFNEEASAEMRFGIMVAGGTADNGVLLLAATDDRLVGVTVFGHAYAKPQELGETGLKPETLLDVLNYGRVWVTSEDAVDPSDEVHVRAVATGNEVKGAFRGTADGTDTIDVSAFCRWITSCGAGEKAILEIDMRNEALATADA